MDAAHGYAVAIGEKLLFPAFRLEAEAWAHAENVAVRTLIADSKVANHVRVVPVIVTAAEG